MLLMRRKIICWISIQRKISNSTKTLICHELCEETRRRKVKKCVEINFHVCFCIIKVNIISVKFTGNVSQVLLPA